MAKQYEVGYGKPPVGSRFRVGHSGNPKGRPKGSKGFAATWVKALAKRVKVKTAEGWRLMTMLEASLAQLAMRAAAGDLKAIRLIMEIERKYPELQLIVQNPPSLIVRFSDE
jgi:hypothetical protein